MTHTIITRRGNVARFVFVRDMVTTGYDTYWVLPYFYSMFCIYIYKPWAMLCIPYLHSVSVPPL